MITLNKTNEKCHGSRKQLEIDFSAAKAPNFSLESCEEKARMRDYVFMMRILIF